MTVTFLNRFHALLVVAAVGSIGLAFSAARAQMTAGSSAGCRVESVDYKGWHAEQLSNRWVQLIIVPQNGGRLMQVTFAGHSYLFVNPKLAGKYFPPNSTQWFNYGGDKIWLLPEGNDDEQHWVGNSDVIDDSPFSFRKVSEGKECQIELTGRPDAQTGVQISRTIALDDYSPRIRFHASMKNASGHVLEWSMQSVSQYDTSKANSVNGNNGPPRNDEFWTFTPVNPSSAYLNRYHVRFGPAENREATVRGDGLFAVHYAHLAAELWLDSTAGWLAVVDGTSQYAMVERFEYDPNRTYPGKASVIFWTNGPEMGFKNDGEVSLSADPDASPYYLEAEVNSPMCRLRPGESCTMDTEWFPTRAGAEFHGVSAAGVLIRPLKAIRQSGGGIRLTGAFAVFYSGRLMAHFYDERGASVEKISIMDVNPTEAITLEKDLSASTAARVSLHVVDENGSDLGSLQEVRVENGENH